jgi:CubicO group peptidase (beta-lactamase class C family)
MRPIYWLPLVQAYGWLLLLSASALAQDFAPAFQIIDKAVAEGCIPGGSLPIIRHGQVIEQRAFGVCEIDPMRPSLADTICWIASLTKPITSAAALKLVERNRLPLDAPIEEYLPGLAKLTTKDGTVHKVTVRQLLSHTLGIPASVPLREPNFFTQRWLERELPDVVDAIDLRPLDFPPGTQVNYSNAAPYVVGRIIEVGSGQSNGE